MNLSPTPVAMNVDRPGMPAPASTPRSFVPVEELPQQDGFAIRPEELAVRAEAPASLTILWNKFGVGPNYSREQKDLTLKFAAPAADGFRALSRVGTTGFDSNVNGTLPVDDPQVRSLVTNLLRHQQQLESVETGYATTGEFASDNQWVITSMSRDDPSGGIGYLPAWSGRMFLGSRNEHQQGVLDAAMALRTLFEQRDAASRAQ